MNDETKQPSEAALPISDIYRTPTTFVNQVVGSGFVNGVINVTFATANFSPRTTEGPIDPDLVITSRLRMDLFCAQQLYETLGKQLAAAMTTTGAPN